MMRNGAMQVLCATLNKKNFLIICIMNMASLSKKYQLMTTNKSIEQEQRIQILDILRGFALLGIIFNNMEYFSGYDFMPFANLKQVTNFQLDEKLYSFLDIIITAKFFTLFSILFAVGFYIQYNKRKEDAVNFLKTYRRRIFFLLIIGLIHSLIWSGDILFLYAIVAMILILFRNVKPKNLIQWCMFFLILPFLFDFALFFFLQVPEANLNANPVTLAHTSYPDMTAAAVIKIFQEGSFVEVFNLNFHNLVWKWLGYLPSGRLFTFFGIFLLGYYLASIEFFTKKNNSKSLLLSSFLISIVAAISAKMLGGSIFKFPSTPANSIYKFLLIISQLSLCLFYITSILEIVKTATGKKVLSYLIPLGRMALTNYLLQTIFMIIVFYNFGFGLFGKIGLFQTTGIVILFLALQIIFSNIWLKYFRFGPLEWVWRSFTYKKWINIRY
jgi:uncharacterized protein